MLVPYSWLKEFINLKIPAERVGERLSLSTIGVEEVRKEGKEYILDLEVTYNRGDLLSILGVARELAALYDLKLSGEEERFRPSDNIDNLPVKSTKDLSRLYTLTLVKGLSYQETPKKIKKRLELAGMRPVNLFADITNYVMVEYGQPLHAFDAEKVRERDKTLSIEVRHAKRKEAIKTLDGSTHNLKTSDIIIADRRGPIAIAGVMGSQDTEVTLNTKEILLEAAIFDPIAVRQTARRLGLRSEASTRFEHYLCPENLFRALNKAAKLYRLYGKGEAGGFGQIGEVKTETKGVNLSQAKLNALLGTEISISKAREYLKRLGFKVMSSEKGLIAWPPYFRGDIVFEEDLIEEIARLHGYENLPVVPPATVAVDIPQNNLEYLRDYLSGLLAGLGFSEVKSYPFLSTEALIHKGTKGLLKLRNPISAEAEYLKDSSLLNLLEIARKNAPRYKKGKLFELEKIYPKADEYFSLSGITWDSNSGGKTLADSSTRRVGDSKPDGFSSAGENSYRSLKGVLETLLDKTGVNAEFVPTKHNFLCPNKVAEVVVNKTTLGVIGELHPHLANSYQLKNVAVFELNFEKLVKHVQRWKLFTPISKYPEVYEDFSFFLPFKKQLGPLTKKIKALDGIIREVGLVDLFEKRGERSVTLRLTFQSDTRELSSKDLKPTRAKIGNLIKKSGGKLRS